MTREDILEHYDVDENGFITSPGKFESEMIYVPYFYDLLMHGASDETIYSSDGTIFKDIFNITSEDIQIFPELKGVQQIEISESEEGFIYCRPLTFII